MSKFWDHFDGIFKSMDKMFDHLDEELDKRAASGSKKVHRTITSKTNTNGSGEVNITITGSTECIDKVVKAVKDITDKY